jgi:signal transduction histidine kinase
MAVAGSGAGLGLAIVRGIVQEHNGTISAQSVRGQGTTITVVLPVLPDSPVEPEGKSRAGLVRVV